MWESLKLVRKAILILGESSLVSGFRVEQMTHSCEVITDILRKIGPALGAKFATGDSCSLQDQPDDSLFVALRGARPSVAGSSPRTEFAHGSLRFSCSALDYAANVLGISDVPISRACAC
jgi:hypothetical protein